MDTISRSKNFCSGPLVVFAAMFVMNGGAISAADADESPSIAPLILNHVGTLASAKGPSRYFTGAVRVDMLNDAKAPSRVSTAYVTFDPGARSAWHTHPLGQTLVVTAGVGRVQRWGSPSETIRPGDTVWIPPGVKHWHGATAATGMTHLAITETLDGRNVDWMEQVSDEQYGK